MCIYEYNGITSFISPKRTRRNIITSPPADLSSLKLNILLPFPSLYHSLSIPFPSYINLQFPPNISPTHGYSLLCLVYSFQSHFPPFLLSLFPSPSHFTSLPYHLTYPPSSPLPPPPSSFISFTTSSSSSYLYLVARCPVCVVCPEH